MSRVAKEIICTNSDIKSLNNLINNGLSPKDLVVRCKAILLASEGKRNKDIAEALGVRPNSVGDWRKAWLSGGMDAIVNIAKTGRPRSNQRRDVEKRLREAGQDNVCSASDLSNQSGVSKSTVYRAIAENGSGCEEMDVSLFTDSLVVTIVGIYMSGIEDAIILRCARDDHSTPDGRLLLPATTLSPKIQQVASSQAMIGFPEALALLTEESAIHASGKDRNGMRRFISRIIPELPSVNGEQYHIIYYSPSGRDGIGKIARHNLHAEECDCVNTWIRETGFWIELLGGDALLAGETMDAVKAYLDSRPENAMAFQWYRYGLAESSEASKAHTSFDEDESLETIVTVTAKIENRDGITAAVDIVSVNSIPTASAIDYSNAMTIGDSVGILDVALGDVFRKAQKDLMENYMNEAVKKTPQPQNLAK